MTPQRVITAPLPALLLAYPAAASATPAVIAYLANGSGGVGSQIIGSKLQQASLGVVIAVFAFYQVAVWSSGWVTRAVEFLAGRYGEMEARLHRSENLVGRQREAIALLRGWILQQPGGREYLEAEFLDALHGGHLPPAPGGKETPMETTKKIIVTLAIVAAALSASGCRTGIRRVANAIEGQGSSSIDYEQSKERTAFSYLTSENSSLDAEDVDIEIDPKTGAYKVKLGRAKLTRAPSENQQFYAAQLSQGRRADTEAIAGFGEITKSAVEGAVNGAVNAFLPAYTVRQEQKTERREISAERDVSLAEIHAEAAMHEAPPEAPSE